jgi:hypothetical protein
LGFGIEVWGFLLGSCNLNLNYTQINFQYIFSQLWIVNIFCGNIYSTPYIPNTYFRDTVMYVKHGFLYLILIRPKLTVLLVYLSYIASISLDHPFIDLANLPISALGFNPRPLSLELKSLHQGVTKICRLTSLTNSALGIWAQCVGRGELLRGLSQWVQLYTGAQINFGDLTPYLNLWFATIGTASWRRLLFRIQKAST